MRRTAKLLCAVAGCMFLFCPAPVSAAPIWSYDDDYNGQEDWGALEGYGICRSGTSQSPVVLSFAKVDENLPTLAFNYGEIQGTIRKDRQSFILEVANASAVIDGKDTYHLQRIALHTPSEHMLRQQFFPAEIQLVHQDKKGDMLIVSVFTDVGEENPALKIMLGDTPEKTIDGAALLPAQRGYYAYNGSLTHPPCTENVKWRVMKNPITLSHGQLTALSSIVGRNARLPQPLYMRAISETK